MECQQVKELFADLLMGNLTEAERDALRIHWSACAACSEEAEGLEGIWAQMGMIKPETPGPAVKARFRDMLAAYQEGQQGQPKPSWPEAARGFLGYLVPRQPAFQFVWALVFLTAGWLAGQQGQTGRQPQPDNEIAELRGELRGMRQMVAISLLQQQSAAERLRGVNFSYQLEPPAPEILTALLDALKYDPSVNVRLSIIDALRRYSKENLVRDGVLQALAAQEFPIVQLALIDWVVEMKEAQSVEILRQLQQNSALDAGVRQKAAWGIDQLN